jgi:K+-sensing histidine kinase KdpD
VRVSATAERREMAARDRPALMGPMDGWLACRRQWPCMTENLDRNPKFLSLAVHEFRTPLSVVSGYLRMLLRHYGRSMPEQQRMLVELGENSCGSMAKLLADLSDLAHLEGGHAALRREPVRLVPLLLDVARDVHEGETRGITFGVRQDGVDVQVLGDRARLAAAFSTLAAAVLRERAEASSMLAACRVVEEGGGTVVRTAITEASAIDASLDGGEYEAFDEYRGGLGFRILLASRIVAAHGGRIVSPAAARGRLAIVISLPVATDAERIG